MLCKETPTASTELSLLQSALLGVGFPLQYSLWRDCSSPLSSAGVTPPRPGPEPLSGHSSSFSPCPREDFPQKGLWQGSWGCPSQGGKQLAPCWCPAPEIVNLSQGKLLRGHCGGGPCSSMDGFAIHAGQPRLFQLQPQCAGS